MSAQLLFSLAHGVSPILHLFPVSSKIGLTMKKDRCLQTSVPIAYKLGLPIYVEQGVLTVLRSKFLLNLNFVQKSIGIGEWFSPAAAGSGVHPRPGSTDSLKRHFPDIDTRYKVTWLPSRRGENVAQIHERATSFLHAFFARLNLAALGTPIASDAELDLGLHKNVLFVGHAASVIATIRGLVGDRHLSMRVGCCSLSILVPKLDAKRSHCPSSLSPSSSLPDKAGISGNADVGRWKLIQSAAADFLPNGAERDWGFEDIEVEAGEVVNDVGERGTEGVFEEPAERGLQIELPSELLFLTQPSSPAVDSASTKQAPRL
jgi:transcription factor C subunit 7